MPDCHSAALNPWQAGGVSSDPTRDPRGAGVAIESSIYASEEAKKGMRGWPVATIAFYGPNLSQATKVAVGIVPSETAEPREVRDWKVENGDVRADPAIARRSWTS